MGFGSGGGGILFTRVLNGMFLILQSMFLDILEKSKSERKLVGLNCYGVDEGFYCGYVLEYSEDFLIIQHFTKFGIYDGIITLSLSDVKFIESDTTYLKGIELLMNNQNLVLNQTYKLRGKNADAFTHLFESFIGNKDYLVKFELSDDDIYFGLIEWCDEDYFSIINIDIDGTVIGKATFRFEDLKTYWVDDLECRKRKMLYEAQKAAR